MHILIAEDLKNNRDTLKELIQKRISAEISEAASDTEAFEILKYEKVDMLISDVKMPMVQETDFIRRIYTLQPNLQLIILNLASHENNISDQNRMVKAALQMIHNEYMHPLNRDQIAARLFISSSYFSSLFKNHTGKGFINYLNEYRLEKAAELLIETNHNVSYIAKAVGYSNYPYFCTLFKKKYGMTCIKYRESTFSL